MSLATLLAVSGVTFVAATAPAEAAPVTITASKSAPASVLVGAPITYSITASNPKDDDNDNGYNLSFRDVLPVGVDYVSTSAPVGLGDPQQIAEIGADTLPTGRTILIWSNVADLPDGSDVTITFKAQPNATAHPVGDEVTNQATAYASTDERVLPKFSTVGAPVTNAAVLPSNNATATTQISALEIDKSEPSSEAELVRGVHARPTVYSLKVTNNGKMATNDVKVVDLLPAGLEFLGCGGVDNSSAAEYTASGSLATTPAVTPCLTPSSVTTVNNPTGYPAGVYTRVEWALPANLATNATYTIKYAAGIPLKNNVMPAAGFTATANLDNNTGASTRETGSEISLKNWATATGLYQGVTKTNQTNVLVTATDDYTVTAEDIAVAKSIVDANAFAQGGQVQYRLVVRTSEYTDATGIVMVDTLPDGLCPADAPSDTYTAAALAEAGSGQCAPAGSNTAIKTVDFTGGHFVVTFNAFDLSASAATSTVLFKARMRSTYNAAADETSAGDTYTNNVALTGTTAPIAGTSESGPQVVKDVSSATLSSDAPLLDKRVLRNTAATHTCDDDSWTSGTTTGNWFDSQGAAGDTPFTVGSRVCFQVRVAFPSNTSTRQPVVTDFLPDNLTYEPGTFQLVTGVNTADYTPDQTAINTALGAGSASFRPGTLVDGKRYVEKGQVFAFKISAIVKSNTKTVVDVQGNLAKLRWTDRTGKVFSLRDQADFRVPPVPPVTIDKQVAKSPYTSYADSQSAVQGETVRYRVVVKNAGTSTDVGNVAVWDVLPVGYTCAAVASITDSGSCTNPGDATHPAFTGSTTRSLVRWSLPAAIASAGTKTVTYDVTIPTPTSVTTTFTNTANVRSYTTPTNLGGTSATHYPATNVDTSVPTASQDVPAAKDTATVTTPNAIVTKSNTTSVKDPTGFNADSGKAVPGELVTYKVRVAVPAQTTVYNGLLKDPLPTDLEYVSSSAGYSATAADPATDALPAGTTLSTVGTPVNEVRLALPTTITNSTSTNQVYQVNIVARVRPGQTAVVTRTNTATFTSTTTAAGTTNIANRTATSNVDLIHPVPALTKALSSTTGNTATPSAGDSREFTLTASNGAGLPTLFDSQVVDCVPAGLSVVSVQAGQGASFLAATAGDACSSVPGTAYTVTWSTGTIAAGVSKTLTYVVKVGADAAAGQQYTNKARLTGSSLDDGGNTAATEQVATADAQAILTVPAGTIDKSVQTPVVPVGGRAKFTLTATIPANTQLFNASISDLLPVGLNPASVTTSSVTCTDSAGDCTLPSAGTAMTASGQTVGWFFGDLASSTRTRTITVVFTATVTDNCTTTTDTTCNTRGQVRSNTANLRWDIVDKAEPIAAGATQDRGPGSNPVTYTVQEPATAITKSVSNATPAPGDTFTYTVTASNPGGTNVSDAHDVVVTDVVPVGVVVDEPSVVASGGMYVAATRTIIWNVPLLTAAQGATSTVTFTYDAKLAASGTITGAAFTNTAKVSGYASLPTGGRTYVGPQKTADVTPKLPHTSVTKRVVGDDVSYVGSPQNFEITVTSDGASPAYKVDVSDVLPKNWLLNASSATVKVGDAATTPLPPTTSTVTGAQQTVTWDDLAPAPTGLAVAKTIVITYTATPQAGAVTDPGAGSTIAHTNTVSINAEDRTGATSSGATGGGSYHGGPATATARIDSADLEVTKTGVGTPVAGEAFGWKIAVRNTGTDAAVGPIVVTDDVPDDVSNFSLVGSGWTCSSTSTTWTCTRPGPLAASGADATSPVITATGTIDSDVAAGTDLVNTASVDARTYDPVGTNDSDTETVDVTALADLRIVKNLTGSITAGQNATWTLDVTNLGPSTSRGPITVKDTLPADATYVSADGTGWDCDEAGGVVTCVRDADLPATGQSSAGQITVVAKISAAQTGSVTNTATVTSTTPQPITPDAQGNNTDDATGTTTRTADLFIQKSLKGDDPAVAGSPATYVLDVSNNGPATATDVAITDTLPSYLTYVSGGNGDWDCSAVGQVVTCELDGSLGVGDAAATSVELTVDVASGHAGDIVNEATVVATEDPTGSTDEDTNTPDMVSDLEVEKSHTGDATAGESITYTVKVTNHGPSDTDGPLVVEDTVPDGMTYASVSGGWDCDEDDGTVTCTRTGGLVDGASTSFDLTFDVAPDAGPATVVNNVSVDGPNTDPDSDDNTDSDDTDIVDEANLTVTKTADVSTVNAGDDVTWTIDVTNEGPSTADSITVSDVLPDGVTVVSVSGTGWDCTKAPLACTRDSLDPGAAPSITVVTKVGSGIADGTTLKNTAEVGTSTSGDDLSDNDDSDSVDTTTAADMTLVKTHTGTPVAGEPFTFELTATNGGPSDAQGPITIDDHLPVGMTYVSANDAWSCVADAISATGQDVECTLDPSYVPLVADDDAPTLAMVVDIAADTSGVELDNTATVSSPTDDDVTNNDADDSVTPTDGVDLSITKTHTGPVEVGGDLTFTVGVHNDGPSEARDVEVTDALPTGLTFVSASGTGWTCTGGACTLDDPLAPGADAEPLSIVVTVTPEAYPGVTNTASVTTSSNDTDGTNDDADDDVVVPAKVDLSIVKELKGTLTVGQRGTYSLTVHNDGPTADPGAVTVADQLPAGLTYVSATADGWDCAAAGQLVTCTRDGDFAVDATDTIALTVDVGAAAYPSVVNTATVASPSVDTDPDDNTSTVPAPVAGSALLSIDKSLEDQDDDAATWSIVVTNHGPTETTAPIVVTDQLPKGLKYVSATGDGWACKASGRTITCSYAGPLAVDDTASIEVRTAITAGDDTEITNVATVVGGDSDSGQVQTDDATLTTPTADDNGILPDTGGVAFWLLLAGLALVLAGGSLVARRRHPAGRHV